MTVDGFRLTVSCPSCVGNTSVAFKNLVGIDRLGSNAFFKEVDFSNLLENENRFGSMWFTNVLEELAAIDGKTCGIISTVLLSLQTLNEGVDNVSSSLWD